MTGARVSVDEGASEAEKAIGILRRLVSEGYHALELKNESCLEPLRHRTDFQLLMMDVVFPAEPIAR
jgi:hypothetical protein